MNVSETQAVNKYIGNKDLKFKNQFELFKTGQDNKDFYNNNISYLNSPTQYVVTPTKENMFPNNYADLLKDVKTLGNRRDNTLVINNYNTNIVGQYAKPKNNPGSFYELLKNESALTGGNTKIVDSIDLDRFSQSLTTRNNDYNEDMYVRPESIDGIPITADIRIKEKTLEQLRGKSINSIRLDPTNRPNNTGQNGEGQSINPDTVNITKFKMKSYRDQCSNDDLLKTTGAYLKPEWRSFVEEFHGNRGVLMANEGPPRALNDKNEYRNDMMLNPTQREEYGENTYISGFKSSNDKNEYRNDMMLNPTQREVYGENTYISGFKSSTDKNEYRNDMMLNPTQREAYGENTYISGFRSSNDKNEYRNDMMLNPTQRDNMSDNTYISGIRSNVDKPVYFNDMKSNPTIREELSNNTYVSGIRSNVDKPVYFNDMNSNPTIREETSNNIYISNNRSAVDKSFYFNDMKSNPTIREETSDNTYVSNNRSAVDKPVYLNDMKSNPTIREETSDNTYISNNRSAVDKSFYFNDMKSNPTIREETSDNTYISNNRSAVDKSFYFNDMKSNPTIREETSDNTYVSNNRSAVDKSFYHNNMISNPTIREELSNNTYISGTRNNVDKSFYHNNMIANPTIREQTSDNELFGPSVIATKSILYENNQLANPTLRMTTEDNRFQGPSYRDSTYRKNNDITRSGVVEEVLAKNYNGATSFIVEHGESRLLADNFVPNQTIEKCADLTKRDLMGGGVDQISAGKKQVGTFNYNMKRDTKNNNVLSRVRNVANSYIEELPQTRGYNLLEKRNPINPYLDIALDKNPYVNNMVHYSLSKEDIIWQTTELNDREHMSTDKQVCY